MTVESISRKPTRVSDWRFVLTWNEGDIPKRLLIDGAVIRTGNNVSENVAGSWWFDVPPTTHDRAIIAAETYTGIQISAVLWIEPVFQLPEASLRAFYSFKNHIAIVANLNGSDGQFNVKSLVEGVTTLRIDGTSDFDRNDIDSELIEEIVYLLGQVLRSPLSRLIDELRLVDPGEIRRITVTTIDYFIRHPETWRSRGYTAPKPIKLLDDRSVEDYDVYENRFVLFFLQALDRRLEAVINDYESALAELEIRLPEQELGLAIYGQQRQSGLSTKLRDQRTKVSSELDNLNDFKRRMLYVQNAPMFERVRPLHGVPRANTALRLHPVYGRLYEIYLEFLQEFNHDRLEWLDDVKTSDFRKVFGDYCLTSLLVALYELNFELVDTPMDLRSLFAAESNCVVDQQMTEGAVLSFRHHLAHEVAVKLEFGNPKLEDFLQGAFRLVFTTLDGENEKQTETWLIIDPTWWGSPDTEAKAKVLELRLQYERLNAIHAALYGAGQGPAKRRRPKGSERVAEPERIQGTLIMVHPTPPHRFDVQWAYRDVRLLFTQGDNFVDSYDFEKFGNYRIGSLPLSPVYIDDHDDQYGGRSASRLKRLIRTQLFRIGVNKLCWNCFGTATQTGDHHTQIRYQCRACHLSWGEVKCQQCGGRIIKVDTRRRNEIADFDEESASLSPLGAVIRSEALESRLAISSACESIEQTDRFWAICPSCGNCIKESKSAKCVRCKARSCASSPRM